MAAPPVPPPAPFDAIDGNLQNAHHVIDDCIENLRQQVANLPIPAMNINIGEHVAQLMQVQQQIQQQVAQLQQDMGHQQEQVQAHHVEIMEALARINERINERDRLLPMRLYNASARDDTRLRYPENMDMRAPTPIDKVALRDLTVAQCNQVADRLRIGRLEVGRPVAERKKHISDHLGCAMTFR